ncbi:MAG TPA: DUF2169 domain-containing protein [Burkholderiaceae bacterium]|nr:DUF2169 domain-containing protein [Burkholderiaceae bacterium]
MRIIKPQSLSVLHRCFERDRRAYLCVAGIAYLTLDETPRLLSEQDLWSAIPAWLGDTPLDATLPKPGGEFLVVGSAAAPAGRPVPGLKVDARVGSLHKRLHVFGSRSWSGNTASSPEPFDLMPLTWENAFGGEGCERNPSGEGIKPVESPKGRIHRLPNIEYPDQPSVQPGAPIEPAGFGPIPQGWPQRSRFQGTYDGAWLKSQFPGVPLDTDWRFFCLGSADQWQPEPFRGDEPIELVHLHPDEPKLSSKLPGMRTWIAVHRKGAEPHAVKFLEPRLSTVWLFPNQRRMALIWHALVQTQDEFATEFDWLAGGLDWINQPRSKEECVSAILDRLDPERGSLSSLDDAAFQPAGADVDNRLIQHFMEKLGTSGVSLQRQQDRLARQQSDLDRQLAAGLGDAGAKQARDRGAQTLADLKLPQAPAPLPTEPAARLKAVMDLARKPMPEMPVAGLRAHAAKQTAASQGELAKLPASAAAKPDMSMTQSPTALVAAGAAHLASLPDASRASVPQLNTSFFQRLEGLAQQAASPMRRLLGQIAHKSDVPPALDLPASAPLRERLVQAHASGRPQAGAAMRGANFSGMDLAGIDLAGADLEGADFSGAMLERANFRGASLAHARFSGARLAGARFDQAQLGAANLSDAKAPGASFAEAGLSGAILDGADLLGADLRGATLIEASLQAAQLGESLWTGASIIRCKFDGAVLAKSDVVRASFLECELREVRFDRARMGSADFIGCVLDGARLDGAQAHNLRFVHGCSVTGASFQLAQMSGSSLRGLDLHKTRLDGAMLDAADLSECDLRQAQLPAASLQGALLMRADLRGANLAGANCMQAILQHARLEGADLRASNLYAADLARIRMDRDTRWDDAFTAKARTLPAEPVLRPDPAGAAP